MLSTGRAEGEITTSSEIARCFICLEGASDVGSVHARTILLSARSSVVRAYSSWPPKFRLVPFVVIAILLFPQSTCPTGKAVLVQISPGQISPGQTYSSHTYPGQTYTAQAY